MGFPLRDINRQTVRAPVNPLDKATIISIYPREVKENKVSIQPGVFIIPPGSYDKPSCTVIGPSSWWKDVDLDQPLLEIPVSAVRIADSIIKDYCNGILACNMTDKMLGLFYLPGELNVERIKKDYKSQLDDAARKQKAWYEESVKIADILWARSNGNPLSISDDARLAAHELNLDNKPWLKDSIIVEMKNCPACGFLTNPGYPVCPNCKTVVDKVAYEKMGLKAS